MFRSNRANQSQATGGCKGRRTKTGSIKYRVPGIKFNVSLLIASVPQSTPQYIPQNAPSPNKKCRCWVGFTIIPHTTPREKYRVYIPTSLHWVLNYPEKWVSPTQQYPRVRRAQKHWIYPRIYTSKRIRILGTCQYLEIARHAVKRRGLDLVEDNPIFYVTSTFYGTWGRSVMQAIYARIAP